MLVCLHVSKKCYLTALCTGFVWQIIFHSWGELHLLMRAADVVAY